jgi:hypothetical protein
VSRKGSPLSAGLASSVVLIATAGLLAGTAQPKAQARNPKYALWLRHAYLRGANVAVVARQPSPKPADFSSLRAAGANMAVLSADGVQRRDPPFTYDSTADARLRAAVRDARQAGLYVVIAVRAGPGLTDVAIEAQEPGLQSRFWVDSDARHAFGEMWQRIAREYATDSLVVGYDLIVEPLPEATVPGLSTWNAAIADTAVRHRGIDWPAFADTLIQTIRQVDSLTPILVGATGFTAPPYFATMRPVHGAYLVYDVHQYEPQNYTMQGTSRSYPTGMSWPGGTFTYWRDRASHTFDRGWLLSVLLTVRDFQLRAGDPPVLVGEFGVNRQAPGAAAFIRAETALFDSLRWHGAMWLWGCCGYMQVSSADSISADPASRAILTAYREYWRRSSR